MKSFFFLAMFGSWEIWKKVRGKENRVEKYKERKNGFKINKLFVYTSPNSFHLFSSILWGLNNFKIYKFLDNFN